MTSEERGLNKGHTTVFLISIIIRLLGNRLGKRLRVANRGQTTTGPTGIAPAIRSRMCHDVFVKYICQLYLEFYLFILFS